MANTKKQKSIKDYYDLLSTPRDDGTVDLFVMFPWATGEWVKDKKSFIEAYQEVDYLNDNLMDGIDELSQQY